jgi:restriction system protein
VPGSPAGFIGTLDAPALGRLLGALLEKLGFEPEEARSSRTGVDLVAVSSAPITGGRLYARGIAGTGLVGEDEVRATLETAHAESVGRALLAVGGSFSPEARAAAAGAPLELLDGPALLALVKKHLPAVAATGRV